MISCLKKLAPRSGFSSSCFFETHTFQLLKPATGIHIYSLPFLRQNTQPHLINNMSEVQPLRRRRTLRARNSKQTLDDANTVFPAPCEMDSALQVRPPSSLETTAEASDSLNAKPKKTPVCERTLDDLIEPLFGISRAPASVVEKFWRDCTNNLVKHLYLDQCNPTRANSLEQFISHPEHMHQLRFFAPDFWFPISEGDSLMKGHQGKESKVFSVLCRHPLVMTLQTKSPKPGAKVGSDSLGFRKHHFAHPAWGFGFCRINSK